MKESSGVLLEGRENENLILTKKNQKTCRIPHRPRNARGKITRKGGTIVCPIREKTAKEFIQGYRSRDIRGGMGSSRTIYEVSPEDASIRKD